MLTEKPWRPEAVSQLMIGAMGCFLLSSFWLLSGTNPGTAYGTALRTFSATLTFQGSVTVMLWVFTRKHALSLRDAFGLNLHPRHAILLGLTAGLGFVPVALALKAGLFQLAAWLNLQLPEQSAVTMVKSAGSAWYLAALGFMTIVAAPVAEEGLFRGVLYPALRRSGFPNAALWLSSFAFALIHANVLIFIPLLALSVLLTKLYDRTGNLLACICGHAAFNTFNFIMLLLQNRSEPPAP
jgi:membrane protease YdiL (CAAX protease family)